MAIFSLHDMKMKIRRHTNTTNATTIVYDAVVDFSAYLKYF